METRASRSSRQIHAGHVTPTGKDPSRNATDFLFILSRDDPGGQIDMDLVHAVSSIACHRRRTCARSNRAIQRNHSTGISPLRYPRCIDFTLMRNFAANSFTVSNSFFMPNPFVRHTGTR